MIKGIPILARTAGLLAHLAEEQERPIGFLMAAKGEEAIAYDGAAERMMVDPEIETRPWAEQAAADDAALPPADRLSLRQFALLPRQARRAGFATPTAVGGLAAIAALPFTEKDELRAEPERRRSDRHPPRRADDERRPHLLDERHHRHAELHPADRERSRQLGRASPSRSYAASGVARGDASSRPTMPGRSSPAPRSTPSRPSASATYRSAAAIPTG